MDINAILKQVLTDARTANLIFAILGIVSLGGALIAEYVFGLLPCILCIYQRWPHGIVIVLGLVGAAISNNHVKVSAFFVFISGVVMLTGAGIAFFHTGVELKWWEGTQACGIPVDTSDFESFKNQLMNAPSVRCDQIPWADPIFGLSMANYNVLLSVASGVYGMLAAIGIMRKANNML